MVSSLWINFQINTVSEQSKQLAIKFNFFFYSDKLITTHGCVLAAKKAMWHTSVLITGTANLPFSTSCISITTRLISMKFHVLYALHICDLTYQIWRKLAKQEIRMWCVSENCPILSHFSSSLHHFTKVTLSQLKTPFLWIDFFQI